MRRPLIRLVKGVSARFPRWCPLVWSVHRHGNRVALTFDDGPTTFTPQVLACLARHRARATFFVLGNQVRQHPDLLRQIVAGGHEVGIHGEDHSLRAYDTQVRRCAAELARHGVIPRLVRTPGCAIRPLLALRLWWRNYPTVIHSFDAHDSMRLEGKWRGAPPDYPRVTGGDIILMHDDNPLCVQELPVLLELLAHRQLQPVTVSELLGIA